jgi:hypothetical protein
MNNTNQIKYVTHNDIDQIKWDQCIDTSPNGLIYGYSFYLDTMAKHWDALVLNDYEAIMPLTWNRKFGISYLYQPFLTASLGIFGKAVTNELVNYFLIAIPKKFIYRDIYLNTANLFAFPAPDVYLRTNYVLDLNKPYAELYNNYRPVYRQLLKNSLSQLTLKKDIPVDDILKLASKKIDSVSATKKSDYQNFRRLYNLLVTKNKVVNYGAYNPANELIASGVFFFSHQRAYYVLAGNDQKGRILSASHHVINRFISDNAGSNLVLDFEGSDIESIAFFFRGFNAKEEKYPCVRYNHLPLPLKLLKH